MFSHHSLILSFSKGGKKLPPFGKRQKFFAMTFIISVICIIAVATISIRIYENCRQAELRRATRIIQAERVRLGLDYPNQYRQPGQMQLESTLPRRTNHAGPFLLMVAGIGLVLLWLNSYSDELPREENRQTVQAATFSDEPRRVNQSPRSVARMERAVFPGNSLKVADVSVESSSTPSAQGNSPPPPAMEEAYSEPPEAVPPEDGFAVQAGAFGDYREAQKRMQVLEEHSSAVWLQVVPKEEGEVYRVLIMAANQDEAKKMEQRLKKNQIECFAIEFSRLAEDGAFFEKTGN